MENLPLYVKLNSDAGFDEEKGSRIRGFKESSVKINVVRLNAKD
jgi:hypothetical protein